MHPLLCSPTERRRQKEAARKAPSQQQAETFESLSKKRFAVHAEQLQLKQELVEFGTTPSPLLPRRRMQVGDTDPPGASVSPPGRIADRKQASAAAATTVSNDGGGERDELDAYLDSVKQDVAGIDRRKVLLKIVELQKVRR